MKWKHKIKYWIISLAFFIIAVIIGYLVYALYFTTGYFDSVNSVATLAIGLVSFLISVIALIFSVVTYVSIDSVNALSSMEGNILCNENYNAEYVLLVKQYNDCKTQTELRNKLIQDVNNFFKNHNKTCIAFTDTLQFLIDRLLWFAYVDLKDSECNNAINELINSLEKRYYEFNAISNGNQYVLREHIKLIKNVLHYQSITHEGKEIDANGEMLNIRGRMFMNSVSKTIYYNYLGLEYYKKATNKLKEITKIDGEEYIKKNMKIITEFHYSESERLEIEGYLKEAQNAFDKATLSSEDDILWKGYISFNKARVNLLGCLVNNCFSPDKSWEQGILKAIEDRYFVKKIFISNTESLSFLELEFAKEYVYAKSLHLSILNFIEKNETKKVENTTKAKKLLDEIKELNTAKEVVFNRTNSYLNDVINF